MVWTERNVPTPPHIRIKTFASFSLNCFFFSFDILSIFFERFILTGSPPPPSQVLLFENSCGFVWNALFNCWSQKKFTCPAIWSFALWSILTPVGPRIDHPKDPGWSVTLFRNGSLSYWQGQQSCVTCVTGDPRGEMGALSTPPPHLWASVPVPAPSHPLRRRPLPLLLPRRPPPPRAGGPPVRYTANVSPPAAPRVSSASFIPTKLMCAVGCWKTCRVDRSFLGGITSSGSISELSQVPFFSGRFRKIMTHTLKERAIVFEFGIGFLVFFGWSVNF